MRRHQLMALVAVVLVACVDGGRSNGPSFAISDATHGADAGRNGFFYWLPPLVPAPSPSGDFNRFASPIVTVCELASGGTACAQSGGHPVLVAQFSMTSGSGSEIIRVSAADQHYLVNWHTDLSNLDPAKIYRITVTVDDRDYGFADVEVGLNAKELKNVNRNEFVPLVDGRTLPIKFRIEAGAACAGREASCAEAVVDPTVQETVILENDAGVPLAFGDFPPGWANGPQVVRIERIPDAGFGPGEGPLGTDFPQFPLFFHYFTSAAEPFNLPVRIGVCNVEDPMENAYHPHNRNTTALAMGGTPEEFRVLERAPANDILGNCSGAERESPEIGAVPHGLGDVAASIGQFAASLLAPRTLEASALMVDGGMGGSTKFFTPAGTVDTATAVADLIIESLTHSPVGPTDADLIDFGVTVRNVGTAPAGPFTIVVTTGNENVSLAGLDPEQSSLNPGQSVTKCCWRSHRSAGSYTQTATADFNNVIAETNEANNTLDDRYAVTAVVYTGRVTDPTGDVPEGEADFVSGTATVEGGNLTLHVDFAPGTRASTSRASFSLDVDRNPTTGFPGIRGGGGVDAEFMGVEYVVQMGSAFVGPTLRILRFDGASFVEIPNSIAISFSADAMEATIPLDLLLGNRDGTLNYKVTLSRQVSDVGFTAVLDDMTDIGLPPGTVVPPIP